MNFSKAFKVFELNMLRQSGITVTPQQVGLKSDPIADLQAKNTTGAFGSLLNQMGLNTMQSLTPPVPPTPPGDPNDAAAQAKYQQALLSYQSSFQVYNQRFMQLMMQQMQAMQQSLSASQQKAASANGSSASSGSSDIPIGVGGILG